MYNANVLLPFFSTIIYVQNHVCPDCIHCLSSPETVKEHGTKTLFSVSRGILFLATEKIPKLFVRFGNLHVVGRYKLRISERRFKNSFSGEI